MLKVLLAVLIFNVCVSPVFADSNSISCDVNGITVDTKNKKDCKTIGGNVIKDYMFVINFDTGSYSEGKLRLNGNGTSNVIYFTDRPDRESGHMGVKKFHSIWNKGKNSFKSDPPNATLSVVEKGKDSNSVITISNPVLIGNSIEFDVVQIEGVPPGQFNTGGLFIDGFGYVAAGLR